MQAHEAELSWVATGAGNHHASWFEQGSELLLGGPRAPRSEQACRLTNLYQRIHRHGRAVGSHDQGVDVDTDHVGPRHRQSGEPEQDVT